MVYGISAIKTLPVCISRTSVAFAGSLDSLKVQGYADRIVWEVV